MRAAILKSTGPIAQQDRLAIEEVAMPQPDAASALLKVRACGVCRTDLHIVEGELAPQSDPKVPGHQIVAEVIECPNGAFAPGTRVGVSWIGGTDGTCRFCQTNRENLCDHPVYTGYTQDGGFAHFAVARTGFLHPLPEALEDKAAAPLLCAGIIGFRSLRVAEVRPGQHVGLFGFGSSARLMLPVLQAWDCPVYVATRGARHQALARTLGAEWVGEATSVPSHPLDAAITFAPSGDVVIAALKSLDKGGIVAINAIHLDRIPQFDYDSLLWGERQLRSVANMTRQDARGFLKVAADIHLQPEVCTFPLDQVNQALRAQKADELSSPAVILPQS